MGLNSASIPLDTRNHNQDEVEVMSTDSSSSSSSDSQWSNSHTISSSIIIKRIPSINKQDGLPELFLYTTHFIYVEYSEYMINTF